MTLKESRISFLVLFSLSLLLLAFIILFAWGFMYYRNAAAVVKAQPAASTADAMAVATRVKDSLQTIYASTWNQINQQLDEANSSADSIQGNINLKYAEFSDIRTEISRLLEANKTPTQLEAARIKLVDLQVRLDDWRRKYNDVALENQRLSALLKQLAESPSRRTNNTGNVSGSQVVNSGAGNAALQVMQVQAWQLKAEEEADKMKLKGTIDIVNNDNNASVEMYVVILQPDGRLLKQSGWDSGSFETKEGTRIYSCKLRFDCPKGENKTLQFSLPSSNFQKGMYSIQVYHKGIIVARGNKNIS